MAKKHQRKALALAALAADSNSPVIVVASPDLAIDRKAEIAMHECQHCKTKFGALAHTTPFCVVCGSDEVDDLESESLVDGEDISDDADLSAVTCTACGTHNIFSDKVSATLGGEMHCAACGEPVTYKVAESDADSMVDELDDGDGVDLEESSDEDALDGVSDELDAEESSDEGDDGFAFDTTSEDDVEFSMLQLVGTGTTLNLAMLDSTLVAMAGVVPVALLTKETAGMNSDVFHKQSFIQAVEHTASKLGIKAALEHYGFNAIVAKVPLGDLVATRLEAQLEEKHAEVTAQLKDVRTDFHQCFALANVGLLKNFFKGREHALKAGFYQELSTLGVRNPAKLVTRVFETYGPAFVQTVLATTDELMAKGVDVRNQLAEAIDTTNFVPVEAEDEVEDDAEDDTVEARLAGAGLRVHSKSPELSSTVTAGTIHSLREALPGKRLF